MNQSLRKFWVEETVSKKSSELQTTVIAECPFFWARNLRECSETWSRFKPDRRCFWSRNWRWKSVVWQTSNFGRSNSLPRPPREKNLPLSISLSLSLSPADCLTLVHTCSLTLSLSYSHMYTHPRALDLPLLPSGLNVCVLLLTFIYLLMGGFGCDSTFLDGWNFNVKLILRHY